MVEAQEAFEKLKTFLAMAPTLVSLEKGEPLLLYIAATTQVVNTALVIEREESGYSHKIQRSVYFISEVSRTPRCVTRKSKSSSTPSSSPNESYYTTLRGIPSWLWHPPRLAT
jgi:hypothetical protein